MISEILVQYITSSTVEWDVIFLFLFRSPSAACLSSPSLISLSSFPLSSLSLRSERDSSPQFSVLLKGAICSPAQWRHTTRESRLKAGDWNQKNTEWGFFSPSKPQIWQLLFRFHTAATTEAPQPIQLLPKLKVSTPHNLQGLPTCCSIKWPRNTHNIY